MDRLKATILVAAADMRLLWDASRDLRIPLATSADESQSWRST
jgi:hypothetical protein